MADDLRVGIRLTADGKGFVGELRVARKELDRLGQGARKTAGGLDGADRAARKAERGIRGWSKRLNEAHGRTVRYAASLLGAGGLAIGLRSVARNVVDAGLRMEAWESRLRAATGSAAGAAREIGWLRDVAARLGLDFGALADGYAGFAAAARGTNIEGRQTRNVFEAVAKAAAVMRLSVADTQGVLVALTQIVSKGVVSAEELRQQLGERLAGAFQIAAQGMGLTTEELGKALATGRVMMEDFLPKFAAEVDRRFASEVPAAAASAQAAFNRLGNAIRDLETAASESGVLDWLAQLATGASTFLRALSPRPTHELSPDGLVRQAASHGAMAELLGPLDGGHRAEMERLLSLHPSRIDETERAARARFDAALDAIAEAQGNLERELSQAPDFDVDTVTRGTAAVSLPLALAAAGAGRGTNAARADLAQARRDRDAAKAELDQIRRFRALRARAEAPSGAPAGGKPPEPPPAAGAELAAAYRDRLTARQNLTHVQRAGIEIARLDGRITAEQTTETLRYATALDAADAAERRRQAAEEALAERRRASAEALADYGGAVADVSHEERARQLVQAAGTELQADPAEIIEAARALDEEAAAQARLNAELERERALRESREFGDGLKRALADYADYATDAAANVEEATVGAFRGMEDALTDFVATGKADFSSLADSIIADLARIAVRQAILGPLAQALGGLFGGPAAAPAGAGKAGFFGVLHAGGVAGGAGAVRSVDPFAFAGAPRLHRGGLAGDEVPAILRRGEGVFTPEQMRALGQGGPRQVTVVVRNESGAPVAAEQATAEVDGDRLVVGVLLRDLGDAGPYSQALQGAFGLRYKAT